MQFYRRMSPEWHTGMDQYFFLIVRWNTTHGAGPM